MTTAHVAKFLAMALGLIEAAVGVPGVAAPSGLIEFGRSLQTSHALHVVAAVRLVFGFILLRVAPASRTPKLFRLPGVFIVIAGMVTSLFGAERARAA